jgi:hypothetical protein
MTPSQSQALAAFRRGLKDLASSLAQIKPREEKKPTGKHGELQIVTDGYDDFLSSGEKCSAYEIAAVLRLYRLPEGKT